MILPLVKESNPTTRKTTRPLNCCRREQSRASPVAVAKVYGTVRGDVTATGLIELGRTARVTGNVRTPSLVIEDGAVFDGTCRMSSGTGEASGSRTDGAGK